MRLCFRPVIGVALATSLLAGCNGFDRMANIGEKPILTPIENPLSAPGYKPVSLPMPPPQVAERMPNSLWRTGSRTFFRDLRATRVGDIMTVVIDLNDSGVLSNSSTRTRTTNEQDVLTTTSRNSSCRRPPATRRRSTSPARPATRAPARSTGPRRSICGSPR